MINVSIPNVTEIRGFAYIKTDQLQSVCRESSCQELWSYE